MMHQKAILFKDNKTAEAILKTKQPALMRYLGRVVQGFDDNIWDQHCRKIVFRGNMTEFNQNPDLKEKLFSSENKMLAEANSHDMRWGIGLDQGDPKAQNLLQWPGKNFENSNETSRQF